MTAAYRGNGCVDNLQNLRELENPAPLSTMNANLKGKTTSVSYFRRLVIDLMHFSKKIPSVTLERRMELGKLMAARKACSQSPTWSSIFTKAYAIVSARHEVLRTAYLTFPWTRFYTHPKTVATLAVDRQLDNERIVIYAHVEDAEKKSLKELDAIIEEHRTTPVKEISSYRVSVRLSRVPWPFRMLVWIWGLNMYGSSRCKYFGTFGMSSVGCHGAGILHLIPLLTSTLHYGMFQPSGALDMRLSFDHRVMDASTGAMVLAEMEEVLIKQILPECLEQTQLSVAA
ncbi:hypothetical protein KIH39_10315 [Telmatocola sphagniphila]|uniref:Uncharacterized protein n=1 Tax=Telmatocola sphagniphila TaxID=1123043 RepID=A0A8E6B8U2_9BACT|nr:hypothetical protein [Telmatocola sphagniphila]QVL34275.1 hypothetical protein KIH39_10315 [Telmatocola sphagniphila]